MRRLMQSLAFFSARTREAATGQLRGAAIDVTPEEPLPEGDSLWRHPGVRLTPHVASYAQPATAAATVVENLLRLRRGEPLLAVVDRSRGY